MIHVITSNDMQIKSINKYADNFVIVHMFTKELYVGIKPITKFIFNVYHKDGFELDDIEDITGSDYVTSSQYEYNFIPVAGITPALDNISETIINNYPEDEDDANDMHVALATRNPYSGQIRKYLNEIFTEHELDIQVLDMLRYMGMVNLDRLTNSIKTILSTDFVYQDDPISYSYSVYLALMGGLSL